MPSLLPTSSHPPSSPSQHFHPLIRGVKPEKGIIFKSRVKMKPCYMERLVEIIEKTSK